MRKLPIFLLPIFLSVFLPALGWGQCGQLALNPLTGLLDCTGPAGAGTGTVTSVGLIMPAEFSVSGSPVTTSGTFAVTKATQSANTIYAGPISGIPAAPAFRAQVAADLPIVTADKGGCGTDISAVSGILAISGGLCFAATIADFPIITNAKGGTGDDTSATTGVPRVAAGNWTYDAGVSHLASSTSADLAGVISNETGTGLVVFGTSPTLTTPVINVTSDATGDIYYRNSGGLFTRLAIGSTNECLIVTAGIPDWGSCSGAGGATSISGLTDHKVTRTSATVATATPGQARVGETVTIYTDDCTVTLAASSVAADASVALFYLTSTGTREFGFDSGFTLANVTVAGTGCVKNAGVVTSPPAGSTPLARLLAGTTNDNWDAEAGWTNLRAFGRDIVSAGTALTESISGGIKTLNVNAAVAALLAGTNPFTTRQVFNGEGASASAIKLTPQTTVTSPDDGSIWMTATQLLARINGATVDIGAGGGSYDPITAQQFYHYLFGNCNGGHFALAADVFWQRSQVGTPSYSCPTPPSGEIAGVNLTTGAVDDDLVQLWSEGTKGNYLAAGNTNLWKLQGRFSLSATTSIKGRFGLSDGTGAGDDGVYIRYDTDASDTAFKVCIANAATVTCQTNTITVDTNRHTVLIEKVSTTNIRVTVDATAFNFWSTAGTNDGTNQFNLTFSTDNIAPEYIIQARAAASARTMNAVWLKWLY